jgi:hypothetical protein
MDMERTNRHANHDYHASRMHLKAGGRILGSVPLMKLEGGCYRSSGANHLAGSNTYREAGSVKGRSLVATSTPLSESLYDLCRAILQIIKCLTG